MVVHADTKNYNRIVLSLILNDVKTPEDLESFLAKGEDTTTYFPDDDELKHGFHNSRLTNLQTRGIIYLIESSIRPDNTATTLYGFDRYSLEHLMPKKWRNQWDPCDNLEEERQRDIKLLTLGNLAIIPQSLNASIRDSSWDIKLAGKANKPGLKICAAGLVTVYDALQKDSWAEDDIEDRAGWLYENARNIWVF